MVLILSALVAQRVKADDSAAEVISVLAPKQQLFFAVGVNEYDAIDMDLAYGPFRTIGDSLRNLSGVSLVGQGGQFQSYAIRGFSGERIHRGGRHSHYY